MQKESAELLESILRVDHAGEYGAVRIYEGQRVILGKKDPILEHMLAQEQDHLSFFHQRMVAQGVQPSLFHPLWDVGAFALGVFSGLLGKEAAHACTMAVEKVIDEHYTSQVETLSNLPSSPEISTLKDHITRFRQEEEEHHRLAEEEGGKNATGHHTIMKVVGTITRMAIWLSSRI